MEGKELDFSSLLLTRNVLTLQHRVRKRIPSGYICPPLPPRSPMSAVKLLPMPPPKPRRPLCKSLQQHPNLWVIRKQRTKFFSSKKKSWNLPALRNLYVNSDRFAVFLVHHFWSPARSQPKIRRRQRIAGQSQTCQEDGMLFGRGLEVGVHISKPCPREPQPTAYLPSLTS